MKLKYIALSFLIVGLSACSSDDDGGVTEQPEDYFPLNEANSWTYQNSFEINGQEPVESTETLTVDGTTTVNDRTAYTFSSDASIQNRGAVTGALAEGSLLHENGKLIYNGAFMFSLGADLGIDNLSLPIENLVILDQNATSGTDLSSVSNSIEQNIDLQGQSVPITLNYTLSTQQGNYLASYTAGTQDFEAVNTSKIIVTLSATASLGPISLPILQEQQAFVSTNYYAKDIGLIKSKNVLEYQFEDLGEFGAGTMDPMHSETSQTIESYSVQ